MIAPGTDLIRRASIEELAGHRARALDLYAQAFRMIAAAGDAARLAAPSRPYCCGIDDKALDVLKYDARYGTPEGFAELVRKSLDADIWRHLIDSTGLASLMDSTARQEFLKQVDKDPAPATAENAAATMFSLLGDADKIFRRGLIEAFRRLDNSYKSNDAFKLTDRAVLSHARTTGFSIHWNHWSHADERILDVERVFAVLDGKPQLERAAGIIGKVDLAHGAGSHEAESEYFRARWFKNGNLHLWFLRSDLLQKANRMIAEHYGATLAEAA